MLAGCAAERISPDEKALFQRIAKDIGAQKSDFPQLAGFDASRSVSSRRNFNYLEKRIPGPVIMSSSVFWFKVSLSKEPVDAFDSPMPVLSVEIPAFKKYLQLRVRGKDDGLTMTLVRIAQKYALEAGGKDAHVALQNAHELMPNQQQQGTRGF